MLPENYGKKKEEVCVGIFILGGEPEGLRKHTVGEESPARNFGKKFTLNVMNHFTGGGWESQSRPISTSKKGIAAARSAMREMEKRRAFATLKIEGSVTMRSSQRGPKSLKKKENVPGQQRENHIALDRGGEGD